MQDDRVMDVVMRMSGISAEQLQAKPERRRSGTVIVSDEILSAARLVN